MATATQTRPSATATLLIAADPATPLAPKPPYREEFEMDPELYAALPPTFTMTELPEPAVVAADCIKDYPRYLGTLPADERGDLDLNVEGRWGDRDAVKRFINRALEIAFGCDQFQVVDGVEHIRVENFYLDIPDYSFRIGDSKGEVVDFYSAPQGFEQPISIEARVHVTCPTALPGLAA